MSHKNPRTVRASEVQEKRINRYIIRRRPGAPKEAKTQADRDWEEKQAAQHRKHQRRKQRDEMDKLLRNEPFHCARVTKLDK